MDDVPSDRKFCAEGAKLPSQVALIKKTQNTVKPPKYRVTFFSKIHAYVEVPASFIPQVVLSQGRFSGIPENHQ